MKQFTITIFLILSVSIAYSQTVNLSQKEITKTIDSLCVVIEQNYFDTTLCKGLIGVLKEDVSKGVFAKINSPIELESKLDSMIRGFTKDNHFKVIYDEQWVSDNSKPKTAKQFQELLEIERQESKKINYGFREVKILGGNIGYLKLTSFENPEFATNTLTNAMSFLQNTDALILDLRNNTGGYSEMMALICSYFFNTTTEDFYLPLTEARLRKDGKNIVVQNNVLGAAGASKMFNSKLYVLTNYRTFSAAEWTAFVLKNRKRTVIVGEKTAGGSHPSNQIAISNKFSINIPIGIMVDAITQTQFEGIGVIPDIQVSANDALVYAQIDILGKTPQDSSNKYQCEWHLLNLKSELNPVIISSKLLTTYEGKYGNIELKLVGSKLYSIREGIKTELIPLTERIFKLKGRDDLRIKVITNNKTTIAIERMLEDGTVIRTNK
ncbi:MAG: S41 family peptidase [Bacteroidetes bacterium]|nr:S41 family peptidase [Bacteroidota bacterium]